MISIVIGYFYTMRPKSAVFNLSVKEIVFQLILNVVVFVFFAFDRRIPGIEPHQVFFYLNYAIAGLLINYWFLPKFLYKNSYWKFTLFTVLIVAIVIFVEEAVLEQIFYPDTRGRGFMGVFYNLLSTMPTLTILVGFKFAWDAIKTQSELLELRSLVKESELQFLKSQINPHFLFNNLNNLYAYAVEQSPKTPELILELSAVLRYMLYECKAQFVPLHKDIEHLVNYINLSKLQIEGRGHVNLDIDKIPNSLRIAPLLLTVFVENAFKHSASSQTGEILIEVKAQINSNGMLYFNCNNTYQEQTNTEHLDKGIGLKNVKKRLELIYANAHNLEIKDNGQTYNVALTLDLSKTQL